MMSTQSGLGEAYAFMHIEKDYLDGKKLKIRWRWYLDYNQNSYTLGQVHVVDNVHNRKEVNQAEFDTANNVEHPVADYTSITPLSYNAACNNGWISWDDPISNVLDLDSFSSDFVTIMINAVDPWSGDTTGLEVDYLQILDSSNNVLKEYHFPGLVSYEYTGSYYDYGMVRKSSSLLYGSEAYAGMGAPTGECSVSEDTSDYIRDLFYDTGIYGYLADSWGENTEPSSVYSTTDSTERYYDYSTVFYKGHIWQFEGNNCDDETCDLDHFGIFNSDGTEGIADYYIDDEVVEVIEDNDKFAGTHDFIFIWACGHGDESRVGVFDEDHSSGLLTSWMHLDSDYLSSDGYDSPDDSDHAFISFEWLSIWYKTPCEGDPTFNYAHWVYYFYKYALEDGYSIKEAIDIATYITHDESSYPNSPLDDGFWLMNYAENPPVSQWSKMRVWGDGNHILPH